MSRHLNAFAPYSLPPNHEDQLTRAAMIVLRTGHWLTNCSASS
ncbi:MAG: hypothetical protein ACYCV4_06815 [Dermatophilaceae bacterium]